MAKFKAGLRFGRRYTRSSARNRGVVIVYVTLGLIVFLGMAGLAVDVSHLHSKRARVQRAADAAALAGAIQLARGYTRTTADSEARRVAIANGYNTNAEATFTSLYPVPGQSNWYQVRLSRVEPLFFMSALGFRNLPVAAQATSLYEQPAEMGIYPVGQQYGATGRMNLAVFGPDAEKQHGDAYSVRRQDSHSAAFIPGVNAGDANSDYTPDGYNFFLNIPDNFSSLNNNKTNVWVEIYDPDSYNNGSGAPDGVNRIDEIRPYGNYTTATSTQYNLYFTKGTADTTDDTLLATSTFGGTNSANSDMKWVQPNSGFTINLNDSRWGDLEYTKTAFRVNVRSTIGTSENGFLLRAGPNRDTATSPFVATNGTSVVAQGRIPINFNSSGSITVELGYVPANATKVTIDKFDTDVGAQSVTYSDGVNTYTGVLTLNAQHRADVFTLPANYPGRPWRATYNAGQQDTSSWSMFYSGPPNNMPGLVKLIR